jgi:toxin ParE1/3/4
LSEIGDFIAADDPRAAIRFILGIRGHCSLLKVSPRMGRPRNEIGQHIRSFAHGRLVIYYSYSVELDHVYILRIWAGRRARPLPSDLGISETKGED